MPCTPTASPVTCQSAHPASHSRAGTEAPGTGLCTRVHVSTWGPRGGARAEQSWSGGGGGCISWDNSVLGAQPEGRDSPGLRGLLREEIPQCSKAPQPKWWGRHLFLCLLRRHCSRLSGPGHWLFFDLECCAFPLGSLTASFTLEVFVGGRRETLVSLAFCRGP